MDEKTGNSGSPTFNAGDYAIFENASKDVVELVDTLTSNKEGILNAKKEICNPDVFCGAVATSCEEALEELDKRLQFSIENFSNMKGYFSDVASAYKKGDKTAMNMVLSVGEDGKLSASLLSQVSSSDTRSIFDYCVAELQKNGMDIETAKVAASAMMGNAFRETGGTFDPTLANPAGTSHGIFQWRNGTAADDKRWDEVVAWCSANGYDANTLDGQIAYTAYDITKGRYYYVGDKFKGCGNTSEGLAQAAQIWLERYEGAKRETVARYNPQLDYDARYLNPCVSHCQEYYAAYH